MTSSSHTRRRRPAPRPGQIRLVAVDVDGTLLRSDKSLGRRSIQAIRQAVDAGVRVILATARPPRSVRPIYDQLALDTLLINYNGALIFDPVHHRILYHRPLDALLVRRLIRLARRLNPDILVSLEILDRWFTDRLDPRFQTETSKTHHPDYLGPLDAVLNQPVTKLMFLAEPQRLEPVRRTLARHFRRKITIAVSDPHLIQINHPYATKARALARIARYYHIPSSQVLAIGDAPNDAGMLRWARWGVAVGNAWPQLRRAADVLVASNDDEGVAQAIEQYVLPH